MLYLDEVKIITDKEKIGEVSFSKMVELLNQQYEKNKEAENKELSQLLHELNQLISGYSMDESWSEWDESVRQRLHTMQYKILALLPSDSNAV